MSTDQPGGQPEYLGPGAPSQVEEPGPDGRRTKRTAVVAAAALAAAAAVGVGTYGVVQLMSGGSSPAVAVPADALGYVSLDLDPSAGQKIEAFKIMRKFPGLRDQLKLGNGDDLRREVIEKVINQGKCSGLDYDRDVKPWIGDRVALAAVPDTRDGAAPLVALQVSDAGKAEAGVRKLVACGDAGASTKLGVASVGDYLLVAETQKKADSMAHDAEAGPLADDASYKTWMGRMGDPGIVTMYASKDAPDAISAAQKKAADRFGGGAALDPFGSDRLSTLSKDFDGAAGVVRFHDGAVEAEFAAKGLPNAAASGSTAGENAAALPATTAATLSVAFTHGWLAKELDSMRPLFGAGSGAPSLDQMLREGSRMTGLHLPDDLETMLGDGVAVSLDSSVDLTALSGSPDPTKIPAGVRIQGDTDTIVPLVQKLKRSAGPAADMFLVKGRDGTVVVGTDPAYVDTLLEHGSLGDQSAFKRVVPEGDKAGGVLFVNFDAGEGFAARLSDLLSDGDPKVKANIEPLDALGFSAWKDGDVDRALFRLTTD
jgi:hypothetical protein